MTKDEIRAVVREKRRTLSGEWIDKHSGHAQAHVESLKEFREAGAVCCYMAMAEEVQTMGILETCWERGKKVCVPAYVAGADEYCPAWLEKGSALSAGMWGIKEPAVTAHATMAEIDVIIVPGLAYDASGNRLGHGRGYYDRMMASDSDASPFRMGLGFEFQVFDSIPCEDHDVRLDCVITERKVLRA